MLLVSEEEGIYFPKIRRYLKEVTTSYEIGNYRSAVVMLYSIVICDLLLKLEELKDTNNDGVAKEILEQVEKTKQDKQTSSYWEWVLIKSVREKTRFLDNEGYAFIESLYSYRNMCAHPAVNDSYELYYPNQETVIALIKNAINTVLTKPPIYIKKVFDTLIEDIAEKKEIYENDPSSFKVFLKKKYYDRMSFDMKLKTAKTLWKFVFELNDEECRKNRKINYWALVILTEDITPNLADYIKEHNGSFNVSALESIRMWLVYFLTRFPVLWSKLSGETQYQLNELIEKNNAAKALSWFKYTKMPDLLPELVDLSLETSTIEKMYHFFTFNGYHKEIRDFFIIYYGKSLNYDMADQRFDEVIKPYYQSFSDQQIEDLISVSNEKPQCYRRRASEWDNSLIVAELERRSTHTINLEKYENFRFSDALVASELHKDEVGDSQ